MKLVKAFALLTAMLVLSTGAARVALAGGSQLPEPCQFQGDLYFDMGTGAMYVPKGGGQTEAAGDVYNNTVAPSAANFGFSATDVGAQFGDELLTTGTGILQENVFTIFNGGTAGALLTATVHIELFNAVTSASLGGYNTNVNFGAGLNPGFFSRITATGLGGLGINVNTTDVIILQQITAQTGTATKLGIASLDPPTVGSSPNTFFVNAPSVGPAGFYNIGNPPLNANPGYRVNVNQPVPADSKSWGAVKALYR
jgi:hypothetical protein